MVCCPSKPFYKIKQTSYLIIHDISDVLLLNYHCFCKYVKHISLGALGAFYRMHLQKHMALTALLPDDSCVPLQGRMSLPNAVPPGVKINTLVAL